ncbi:MAG: beta-ketoacyl synthase N-terminal-like domain-containing protein [Caldilineaceae bacterium]
MGPGHARYADRRFCASGLEAVNLAAMKVRAGWEQLVVAGGVESMSRVPMGRDGGALMDDPVVSDAIGFVPQGISADLIATLEGFSRAELDAYAVRSQQRAARAHAEGRFRALVPVVDAAGAVLLDHDEHMRPQTTLEALAALPPAFVEAGGPLRRSRAPALPQVDAINHVHTAGNSSGIVDGARWCSWAARPRVRRWDCGRASFRPRRWWVRNRPSC